MLAITYLYCLAIIFLIIVIGRESWNRRKRGGEGVKGRRGTKGSDQKENSERKGKAESRRAENQSNEIKESIEKEKKYIGRKGKQKRQGE